MRVFFPTSAPALLVLLGIASLAVLPSACKSAEFHRATRAENQRDVGSVHVNVLAVAPWSRYADALQPRFQLTADQARDLVIRDTRQEVESNTNAASTGLSATEKPATTGMPPGPDSMRSFTGMSAPSGVEGRDAMMEYWTANGLFQEVQILNRVLRDAVIPTGFRPYLVRLQISLIPRRRHQPYDAYTTISFFCPDGTISPVAAAPGTTSPPPEIAMRGETPRSMSTGGTGPVVLPMLVTDNLEASLKHRSSQDIQRLAFSLLALPGDWAGKLSADLFSNEFQGMVAGRDLNALLTVARVSQNTLRVRIGAMAESTADYAMVPRNHSVTLLVMVPVAAPAEVELVARTTLVDTDTGDELPDSTQAEVEKLLAAIGSRYGLGQHGTKDLQNLLRCAQANDQRAFRALLAGTAGEGHEALRLAQSLWIELVNLLGGSQFASVRFELPGHGAAETLPSAFFDQTLVVIDSGRAGSETLVRNASFPEGARVEGTLALESAGQALSLPAESVVLDRETRTVRLAFPSLSALGLAGDAQIPANLRVLLRNGDEPAHAFDALYLPPPPANPTYTTPNPFGLPGAATPSVPQGIPR